MSRVAWIDASVGVAGDMLLAALLDAGAPVDDVVAGLQRLDLPGGWTLAPRDVQRGAFRALYLGLTIDGDTPDPHAGPPGADGVPAPGGAKRPAADSTGHTHTGHTHTGHTHGDAGHTHTGHTHGDAGHTHTGHTHGDAGHTHTGHTHSHGGPGGAEHHVHRPYREVLRILASGELPPRVYQRAVAVYERLARAEAWMHGMALEDVVLHEVGAVDAILDIVGCCLALELLGVDHLVATPLPMGTGAVNSAHGVIPLPAPATLAICRGYPVVPSRWPGEWVTPTGAALITALCEPGGPPAMVVDQLGLGAGGRDPSVVANVLRVAVGERSAPLAQDTVIQLACEVDDLVPEHLPGLIDGLLDAGALDAHSSPVTMKHGRPGLHLVVLCRPADESKLAEYLLRHSTTLGLRRSEHQRHILDRWFVGVQTPYGEVRVKVGGRDGEPWHSAPEHRDVARCAAKHGVSEREVYDAAVTAYRLRA